METLANRPDGMTSRQLAEALSDEMGKHEHSRYCGVLRSATRHGWVEQAGAVPGQRGLAAIHKITSDGAAALQAPPPRAQAARGTHPWDAEALRRNQNGESVAAIADDYGVNPSTVKKAIERQGATVKYPLRYRRRKDSGLWRDSFLRALRRSGDPDLASLQAGVSTQTVRRHRQQDADFATAMEEAVADGRLASRADQNRQRAAARNRILGALRAGQTFKAAAEAAGVPLATAKHWRRSDPAWDRCVIADAAIGGTFLALSARDCPGRHCATATGYDRGCREQACTQAKSRQVTDGRARRAARN